MQRILGSFQESFMHIIILSLESLAVIVFHFDMFSVIPYHTLALYIAIANFL